MAIGHRRGELPQAKPMSLLQILLNGSLRGAVAEMDVEGAPTLSRYTLFAGQHDVHQCRANTNDSA